MDANRAHCAFSSKRSRGVGTTRSLKDEPVYPALDIVMLNASIGLNSTDGPGQFVCIIKTSVIFSAATSWAGHRLTCSSNTRNLHRKCVRTSPATRWHGGTCQKRQ